MYKIDFVKQLDKGTSNVEIEGEVTFAKEPINIKSKPEDKKPYDFWSQWLFLRDDTESIGVSIAIGKKEDEIYQGDRIVVKGRIDEYIDKNEIIQKKLVGRIVKPKEEVLEEEKIEAVKEKPQVVNVLNQATVEITKEQKEMEKRNISLKVIEIVSNLVIAKQLKVEKLFSFTNKIVKAIYAGIVEDENNNQIGEETKVEEKVKQTSSIVTKKKEETKEIEKEKKEDKIEEEKVNRYLEKLFIKAKEIGLDDWKHIIYFAVQSNVFKPGIAISEAKEELFKHKEIYNTLSEAIEAQINIEENENEPEELGGEITDDIPF